jgi:NAD(P)-dependent dehydrogenase (short-subunit alcohol dehydrogenase family)
MNEPFDGKVALVTGAGSGIGLATAKAFAEAGASVVLADRHAEAVGAAARELTVGSRKALAIRCDVTDKAQVTAMIEQAVDTYGRLDAAFNNAGINCENAPLLERSDDEFDRIINVNIRGVWNCMKAELRQMTAQGSGSIVNCSSIGGMVGSKGRSAHFRKQARGHRPDAVRRTRLCRPGDSHQRGLPGDDQHTNGDRGDEKLRSRDRQSDGGAGANRALRRA